MNTNERAIPTSSPSRKIAGKKMLKISSNRRDIGPDSEEDMLGRRHPTMKQMASGVQLQSVTDRRNTRELEG